MNKYFLLSATTTLIFIFTACGNSASSNAIVGYLIDSPVWGADYHCDNQVNVTNKDGKFECKNFPITFTVGDITLGSIDKLAEDKKVFPQDIIGVDRENINDEKVVQFAQFLQSLDDDGNIDEAIKIKEALKDKLHLNKPVLLDTLDTDKLNTLLEQKVAISLISEEDAKNHLSGNLIKGKEPQSIELTFSQSSIPLGLEVDTFLKGIYYINNQEISSVLTQNITYISSDVTVATIDEKGKINTHKEGSVTITSRYKNLHTSSVITVLPSTLTSIKIVPPTYAELTKLAQGKYISLYVRGYYSQNDIVEDVTNQVRWSSVTPQFSDINSHQIKTDKKGNASIKAQLEAFTDRVYFEIKPYPFSEHQFVQNFDGNVSLIEEIYIPKGSNITLVDVPYPDASPLVGVHVEPIFSGSHREVHSKLKGFDFKIGLLGFYKDHSNLSVTQESNWSIENTNFFETLNTYASKGRYKAIDVGETMLSVKTKEAEDKQIKIIVTDAATKGLVISYEDATSVVGYRAPLVLTAHILYSDDSQSDISAEVVFQNLTPEILALHDRTLTALKKGTGIIEASYNQEGSIYKTKLYFYVGDVRRIEGFANVSVGRVGEVFNLKVIGDISSNSYRNIDITKYLKYRSSDTALATVDLEGKVTTIKAGKVFIEAYYESEDTNVSKTIELNIR